ncbi:related to RNA polymerase II transcriptional coactivator [Cephalotrichum gorgonifer]|uniref:Related to RNA polymerase II transcriptional coactivator n=1 Tax=Cephalotrichum gorgonifer TaxID=2041049 RepID=A0AAE8SZC4_9PEZI|nr:related to RNA polymerase II transcriptional coactivator [Cephalotrichum gorgonifer]
MARNTMKRRASIDDDSGSEAGAPLAKKPKSGLTATATPTQGSLRDDDGNAYWELPKNRRVTVSEFRQSTFVNIREYYKKDDKFLPGKKGISLNLEEYGELLKAIPAINAELKRKTGQSFDDPDDTSAPPPKAIASKKVSKSKSKSNIEMTSEEED